MKRIITALITALVLSAAIGCDDDQAADEPAEAEAAATSATLEIEGMTCVNCAADIEERLSEADGVVSGTVDFGERQAQVEYDPDIVDLVGVIEAIEGVDDDSGFSATVVK